MSDVRWIERGEGTPVVLLHGLTGAPEHWVPTLDLVGAWARAIAPGLPLFDPAMGETSIAMLADWAVRFLDRLEIDTAVVGGNSLGGHVALALALAHPDRLRGLVLSGSSGLFERGLTRGVPHRPSVKFVREKMEEIVYDRTLVTPNWVEEVHRVVRTPASALRLVRMAHAAKRDNLADRLREIQIPTLLVWGEADRITPLPVALTFHALIPDATLLVLRRCGHVPMMENPEAFAGVLVAWLREIHGHDDVALGANRVGAS